MSVTGLFDAVLAIGILCAFLTTLASASGRPDFQSIVTGVTRINSPGIPGPLWPTSEGWETIVSGDESASVPSGVVMARQFGAGRIIASAEASANHSGRLDNGKFTRNVFAWLCGAQPKTVGYSTGHSERLTAGPGTDLKGTLTSAGYTVKAVTAPITPTQLGGVSVLVIGTAWSGFSSKEVTAVQDFVSGGGGLYMTGLGWSWVAYHQGSTLDDFPMSKMAAPLGITWLDLHVKDPDNYFIDGPAFHVFYPQALQVSVPDALATVSAVNAEHPTDLPEFLQTDSEDRNRYLAAHAILRIPGRLFASGHPQREQVFEFYKSMMSSFPAYFRKLPLFDCGTFPQMVQLRERVFINHPRNPAPWGGEVRGLSSP